MYRRKKEDLQSLWFSRSRPRFETLSNCRRTMTLEVDKRCSGGVSGEREILHNARVIHNPCSAQRVLVVATVESHRVGARPRVKSNAAQIEAVCDRNVGLRIDAECRGISIAIGDGLRSPVRSVKPGRRIGGSGIRTPGSTAGMNGLGDTDEIRPGEPEIWISEVNSGVGRWIQLRQNVSSS
jgi:hypothetical protein